MSPISIRDGKLIYHQTSIRNLMSIVEFGLLSRAMILSLGISFNDVADQQIIEERTLSGLDVYVPFHFHPRTVFDYKIRYDHPNDSFIFLCMYRDVAQKCNALVLPAHPLSNEKPIVYNYTDGFNAIDWETMELTQGVLGYNSQIRMAECLIKDKVDISKISIIYVKNQLDKKYVEDLLKEMNINHINVYVGNTFFGPQ